MLLCTDAAAEGLNLQTCGALINYDLPWNPMRVEQRIGRIDRIGQPRDVIRIDNLYYQGTIETQVYTALQERIHLFGDVVGKLQPILARTATLIERGVLQQGKAEPILSDLNREIEELDREAFDLDASLLEDLSSAANIPAAPYDLEQLSLLLDRPNSLPAAYRAQPLGTRQWAIAQAGGAATRVTTTERSTTKTSKTTISGRQAAEYFRNSTRREATYIPATIPCACVTSSSSKPSSPIGCQTVAVDGDRARPRSTVGD